MEKLATDIYYVLGARQERVHVHRQDLTLIGLAFSKEKRTIVDSAVERL